MVLRQVLECSGDKWQPHSFPGNVLVCSRAVVVLVAGLCMDVWGRRGSAVVWMGLYFIVSLARTFSPNPESVVFCVTLEGAAAQAATMALLLLGGSNAIHLFLRFARKVGEFVEQLSRSLRSR